MNHLAWCASHQNLCRDRPDKEPNAIKYKSRDNIILEKVVRSVKMKDGSWTTAKYRYAVALQIHSAVSIPFVDGILTNPAFSESDGNFISAASHESRRQNCESMLCTGLHTDRNILARLHMPGDVRG